MAFEFDANSARPEDQFDPTTAKPEKPAGALRKLGDLGLSAAKGVIAVPEAAVGLADIATGGRAGKAVEGLGVRFKDAKDVLTGLQSEDLKGKQQQFSEADGVIDKAGIALRNPSLIANSVAESIPLMGAGAVPARALLAAAPRVGAAGAGAIGEGLAGAGSAAEGIRQETPDGLMTGTQAGLAGASGALTAGFGALGGKLAQRLGIADVDTALARGSAEVAAGANPKNFLRRGAEGAVSEGLLEELPQSLSEQALQNIALDKPVGEGLADAAVMGTLAGGVMGAGAGIATRNPPKPKPEDDKTGGLTLAGDQPPEMAPVLDPATGGVIQKTYDPRDPNSRPPLAIMPKPEGIDYPEQVKPSARMGIDPAAGPISSAAALAVDSGAHQQELTKQILQSQNQDQQGKGRQPGNSAQDRQGDTKSQPSRQNQPVKAGQTPSRNGQPGAQPSQQSLIPESQDQLQRGGPSGNGTPSAFKSYEEAQSYITEQKQRGTSVQALPLPQKDGSYSMAMKGTADYTIAEFHKKQMDMKAAGVLDGDILTKSGDIFAKKAPAVSQANKAGAGHVVVPVQGGFVIRKQEVSNVSQPTTVSPGAGASVSAGSSDGVRGVVSGAGTGVGDGVQPVRPEADNVGAADKLPAGVSDSAVAKQPPVLDTNAQAATETIANVQNQAPRDTNPSRDPTPYPKRAAGVDKAEATPEAGAKAPDTALPAAGTGAVEAAGLSDQLEDALFKERDATTSAIENDWMKGNGRRRLTNIERSIYDAVTASTLDADSAAQIIETALENDRPDLAQYAASRAMRAAESMDTTPGVPQSSPKYGKIKSDLEASKKQALDAASALQEIVNSKQAPQAADVKAITAKQIPAMTDVELQQAIEHYGPESIVQPATKTVAQPTEKTSDQAPKAKQSQTKPEAGKAAADIQPAAGPGVGGKAEAKPVKAAPYSGNSHFAGGKSAHAEGKPRVLPSYFTGNSINSRAWLAGWDAANVAAPVSAKSDSPKTEFGAGFEPVGARAFGEGKPRTLPTELRGLKHSTIADEWYKGYDEAKAQSAAKPDTQRITTDKAETPAQKGLGEQLAELNAELERQGSVQSANTRAQRDTIRKQIAQEDFPDVLKAVDDNLDVAEELNSAFKYAGDEPKAKTIERILKKRGITPEYQARWTERLLGSQKPATVNVPPTVAEAFTAQMQKQKGRITRLKNEAEKAGSLEDKRAAQIKVTAAEATLRQMRLKRFDAEDAAVKAVEQGATTPFKDFADLFPSAAEEIAKLTGQNDELDAEIRSYEAKTNPTYSGEPASAKSEPAAKSDTLSDREKAAKAKMHGALGKLAALASKNTRMNWTPEEEQQLLPIVIELFDGAMELGAVTFQKAVAYVREFISTNLDQETADAIPFDTLQGAYISVAGRHKDKGVTSKKEVVGYESLEELGTPEPTPESTVVSAEARASAKAAGTEEAAKWTGWTGKTVATAKVQTAILDSLATAYPNGEGLVELSKTIMDDIAGDQLANTTDSADTSTKETTTPAEDAPQESLFGANDDTRRNATNDSEPLEQALPGSDSENGPRGSIETGTGLRPTDAPGNGQLESGGSGRGNSLDGSEKPVLPSTPAEIRPLADGPVGKTEDRPQQLSGENPGNFVITDEFKLGQGTDGDKISGNLAAIRTLRQIQKEHRYPTKAEQTIMARYVGWGGLKTVFDPKKADATDQYGKAQRELKSLLSPDEYRAANGSIRNAHYTAEGIVDGMWRVMRFMGFKGGRALEPTIGIGNFVGRMPADMAASTEWHASELDTTTGQLAAMLYPEANILASTGFQDAPFADGAFDISVGNPPFGLQTITDKSPNRKHLNGQKIHNYIIAKAGMHLRPGGVMSMVVTHRFLDTANPEARDVLAKDFRFLGAFRLPNDAFKKNAGTDVVTDVVFLQKLGAEEKRERDASWLDVNGSITVDDQAMRVNRYYQDNPTHILGRSAMDGSMQRTGEAEYTVHSDGRDIGKAIDELMQTGFKHMAGVLEQSNNSKALAPAMLTQSDLPIGGVMVNDEGKIIRRELNDANGNAVVQELTPETLWKDQAADWQALHNAVLDIKAAAKAGKVTQEDANEVLALSRFLFKADGTPFDKPNKAVEAVYKLVEELAKPAKFQWTHDGSLLLIVGALNRKQLGEDGYKSLKGMLDLRNRTLRLIHAEQAGDSKMEEYRADLNKAYDAFVKENGYLSDSKNANLLEGDVGAEAGIEASYVPAISPAVAKSSGMPARAASAKKSDIMTRRVNFPYKEITHADSAPDALFASISEHGKVDLPYMAKITNKSVQSVIEELTSGDNPQLFRDPETGDYQEAERYLSGNVKHKLKLAKEKGLKSNIQALEKALPVDKTKDQVKPNIRGMWMPPEIFTEFLQTIGYKDARISAIASQGILQASGETLAMTDFGIQFRHGKRTPLDMFNSQASGKPIIISVTSNGKTYKDEQGTKEVNAMAERMGKVFQEWAYSDDDRVKRIVEAFNQNMNTHSPRTFDGVKYLKPVGANPSIVMRRTQLDGAWRMMQEKTMLADHVVGAGKTFTLIMGIMERRRMGLSRKPMVVVPNHLVTQWARDFYKLYPGAKVLAANPADFAKKNRRRLLARIATGDYDAVIVGHTSIGFMETPTEDLKAIVDEKLEGLKEALAEARKNDESKRTLGQIEDRIDRYEQRLKDLAARPTDDIGIDFKALGIDHLSVDEAHEFKNLEYSTSGDRVVGMNDPNGSKKAFDLYSKVRGLLARGGGVTFATGTPVSNSLVEIYTMMSYLAHDELVLRGQEHFDSWSGAYAATETRLEYTATQKLKPRRVLAGLNNLSALRQLYEQFADIITMSDLKRIYTEEMVAKNLRDGTNLNTEFPVPKVANGKRELITGDITPAQKEYMDYLVARMGQIEANKSDKEYMRIDNALNVLTDARKMSLDIRIVDPSAKRDENGKVATAAKNIKATYDKWDADRGTQLVFCDLSTPAKTAAKEARSIISATIEQLFGKDLAKQVKKQLEGKTFEQQWKMLVEKSEEISENPDTSEEKRDAIAEFMEKIEDPEATMNVADIGFSVYDDLKTVLMDSGIPESEIAFIHDYNTPDQKEKLFDRVNNGYVRVLIGSSMKMGAGTNVQRRLVALHHMDAPWRPSDVEQREGRIIRQGNTFHTEFNEDGSKNPLFKPDFEVEIKAYSTNQTSDTVMWQILQRKAGAIEQFREGGLDSMEEEGGDSDQYAEFMATSTGNPVFRQKLEAERRLTEIESEIGGALIVRSNANSFLESYDRRRKAAKTRQEALESFDASTASYGGESGTQAEFEAAMKVANDDYLAKYAVWTQKNAAADLAIAKWETEPEATRGDKPSKPTMPSQPDLFTKSVQAASGYARAIGMALNEAAIDKNTKVTMATGSIIVTGQTMTSGPYWTVYANNLGENFSLDSSGAQKASASPRIIQSLMPFSLGNELNTRAKQYARDIVQLDQGKTEALKGSKLEVDTTARDAARVDLRWFTAQVAFAEVQADIDRGATKNRYIERDKRRNISQNQAKALTEPVHHTIDGVKYTTTGLNANSGYQEIAQATRDSDGVPAFIVGQQDKDKISYAVAVQPAKLRKAEASTNLKQTGAPEANTSDVVFSRPTFSRGAQSQANESVERLATGIASHWKNAPKIIVAFDMADERIPAAVRAEDQRQRSGGAAGTPEGFYYGGTVYLMSSQLKSPGDVQRVLFHETLGHFGLRGTFGDGLKPILQQIATFRKAEVDAKIKEYGLRSVPDLDRLIAAEEVLAEMAQNTPEIGFVKRAIAMIRTWLRENGFSNLTLTDDEIITQLILPARAFVEQGGKPKNTGGNSLMRSLKKGDWYSELSRQVMANKQQQMPAGMWASWIDSLKTKGVKPDEIEWSGVQDWLKLQTGKVTKDQITGFLDANGVKITETVLSHKAAREVPLPEGWRVEDYFESDTGFAGYTVIDDEGENRGYGETRQEAIEDAQDGDALGDMPSAPKYGQYTLPGGENYREVLLTLPEKSATPLYDALSKKYGRTGSSLKQVATAEELAAVAKESSGLKVAGQAGYKSNHWDQPNILAHMRLNDRTDAEGKKVLFVEEIQSDWGQSGKKQGFSGSALPLSAAEENRFQVLLEDGRRNLTGAALTEFEALLVRRDAAAQAKTAPPLAPFVTATDKWLSLAMKRVIKMAVDGGYDKVAFVNGEQSASRYELSKHVDSIEWLTRPTGAKMVSIAIGSQPVQLIVSEDGKVVAAKGRGLEQADGKMLDEVLGKDAASQIMAGDKGQLSDRKVGGEGMKAFYDKIVPAAANKLLAKLGGGKIEQVAIGKTYEQYLAGRGIQRVDGKLMSRGFELKESIVKRQYAEEYPDGQLTQPGFTITPAMQEKAAGGMPMFSLRKGQTDSAAFKKWFGDSKVVDADGKPLVVYHGSSKSFSEFDPSKGDGTFWFTPNKSAARSYGHNLMEAYLSIKNPLDLRKPTTAEPIVREVVPDIDQDAGVGEIGVMMAVTYHPAEFRAYALKNGHDGIILPTTVNSDEMKLSKKPAYIAFNPEQIKSATGNNGNFDAGNPDIRFSRSTDAIGETLKNITVTDLKAHAGNRLADYRNLGLQFLGGRQLMDLYGKDIPAIKGYTAMVQQMAADANEVGAQADNIVTGWGKLADERQLAELMHDATLAQIDPAKEYVAGDNRLQWAKLNAQFKGLTPEAQKVYKQARDSYEEHYAQVREAIRDKIERSAMSSASKSAMLERMDGEFFDKIKGVYFPLARFGKYVVVTRGPTGVVNVSRAETLNEAQATRELMRKAYPSEKGFSVGKVIKDKEFNASRDAVGRGFLKELFGVLDEKGMGEELQDAVNQLYLASMPDLSWAKHGIHRKGTPGFSQDARRAFAQNMFHGARYLAKLRYADQLADKLVGMQNYVESKAGEEGYDSVKGQQVVDELNKRHDSLMNPKSNPLSTALTSFGFVFHMGLSPASAMVNLSGTAMVAYPIMGAKWGFDKAATALMKAGKEAATHKNDISQALSADEKRAYDAAVKAGTIDVTAAHDLAGIAQGEDAGVMWKLRPVMKWASFLFHHAERFNRQITFVAAYRLARETGANPEAAFEQATKATYDGHFDYAASNRPRVMQGNAAKVLLLFKQYGQNMVYTLTRQAQQAMNAETPEQRRESRKALAGLLVMHAAGAGVLGLPLVGTLLAAASMIGGSDDEPWDAEVALRNMLADAFGQKPAEVLARGLSRLTPWDISGRVGLDKLILPDIQEGLEGQRLGESVMAAALGPVAGIGINVTRGMQEISEGHLGRGIETMMPAAFRAPLKALRYEMEGAKDKTGVMIKDEVGLAGVAGQALGFSPSEVRNATEGRSAIYAADKRLMARRSELMAQYAQALIGKDTEGVAEAMAEIRTFNEKNPNRRINGMQLAISVKNRNRRVNEAADGVYLPKKRRDMVEEGRFAVPQ